jgi:hypothetical protein
MANLPSDIAQQALDASGAPDYLLGDLEDGSRPAQVLLRAYQQCLMQLLRGANWDFARRTAPLELLADATGNTPNVGTIVPVPWTYSYGYPVDCVKARFIPWNQPTQTPGVPPGNITPPNPNAPIVTGLGNPQVGQGYIRPARFVIANDINNPPPAGSITWETQGLSPSSRTVILTNVQQAMLVYTALILYPSLWDSLFRAALVAYLASEIALPLSQDKKLGLMMRQQNIAIAKAKIEAARIRDGNEGSYSSNLSVDWMRARWTGGAGGWGNNWGDGGGPAVGWGGFGSYDCVGFGDGSSY